MIRNIRITLFAVTLALICIGVVMIYSASSIYALDRYKDSLFFVKRHICFLLFGMLLAFLAMVSDYRKFSRYSKPLLLVCLFLLLLVLVPGLGREVSGARRWFRFKFYYCIYFWYIFSYCKFSCRMSFIYNFNFSYY